MKSWLKRNAVVTDLLIATCLMLVLGGAIISSPAEASSLAAFATSDSDPFLEILSALVGSEKAGQWLGIIGLVCYVFTHIVAWLPPSWLVKLPTWLIKCIEYLAGNYRGTKNERDSTTNSIR